jgi:hypothetical protein
LIDGLAALRGIDPAQGEGDYTRPKGKPGPEDEEAYAPFANNADWWKAHLPRSMPSWTAPTKC